MSSRYWNMSARGSQSSSTAAAMHTRDAACWKEGEENGVRWVEILLPSRFLFVFVVQACEPMLIYFYYRK